VTLGILASTGMVCQADEAGMEWVQCPKGEFQNRDRREASTIRT